MDGALDPGQQNVYVDRNALDIRGDYDVTLDDQVLALTVEGEQDAPRGHFSLDSTKVKVKLDQDGRTLTLGFQFDTLGIDGWWRATGNAWSDSRIWEGKGQRADGTWFDWSAIRQETGIDREAAPSAEQQDTIAGKVIFPFTAYGNEVRPNAQTVWFENATIWTCEEAGILEGADLVLHATGKFWRLALVSTRMLYLERILRNMRPSMPAESTSRQALLMSTRTLRRHAASMKGRRRAAQK
jgi:hypothetical protein